MRKRSFAVCVQGSLCVVAVTVLLLASGCDYFSGKRQRVWSEEVRLDDRSIITVDRYVEFEESNALGGGVYSATETRSTLSFRNELASLPKWDVPLVPILLYRDPDTMEWVIVAASSRCEVWYARGGPLPPYWEYQLGGTGWRETPLSTASLNRETNLFFLYNQKLPSKHLDLSAKSEARSDGRISTKYLTIIPSVSANYCGNWPRPARPSSDKEY